MTYIIAELGSTPDGSLGNWIRLAEECHAAGADAVKGQDHRHERIKGSPPWATDIGRLESRAEYLQRTAFDQKQWQAIRSACSFLGVDLIVSPFSVEAVHLLKELPVDAYKVASGQVTNGEMLIAIAKTGKRVYLSSGMTSERENMAARAAFGVTAMRVTQMHCTSEYPCSPEQVGLNLIKGDAWLPFSRCGFSDHTTGFAASLAAITLGASVIERHVTFDRRQYGSDARHSLTVDEFARFVREVRELDRMLANPVDKEAQVNSEEMKAMRKAFLE